MHDEIALAKAEMRQDVKRGVVGSGAAIGRPACCSSSRCRVLSFAAAYGLHNLGLGLAWSFLIVGGAYHRGGAAAAGCWRVRKFRRIEPPEKSIASAKETAAVLSHVKPHPAAPLTNGGGAHGRRQSSAGHAAHSGV